MPAYRGMARNALFEQILPVLGGICQGLYLPSGITVSAGSNVNGWTDSSGNGRHLVVGGGTPQRTTVQGGWNAISYNGTTQYMVAPVTWATYLPGNVHWMMEVWQPQAAGGAGGAGLYYNNKGPGPSDPLQWIDMAQFSTVAGVDSDQCEIWVNAGTVKDTSPTTTDPGSTTRSLHLYETWIDAGAVMTTRTVNGRGTRVTTVAGVTGYNIKTGTPVFGKTGAAVPFMQCLQSFIMMCSASPGADQQAFVRKILGRAYGLEW